VWASGAQVRGGRHEGTKGHGPLWGWGEPPTLAWQQQTTELLDSRSLWWGQSIETSDTGVLTLDF